MNRDFGSDIFEDDGSTPSPPPRPQEQEIRENHPGSPLEKPPDKDPDLEPTTPEGKESDGKGACESLRDPAPDQADPPRQRERTPRRKPRRRRKPQRGDGGRTVSEHGGRRSPPRRTDQERIAILIDIARFEEGTQHPESQVSYSRVIRHVTGTRDVVSAIAYTTPGVKPAGTQQLETREVSDAGAIPVAMTMDAMSLADRIDAIIFIPANSCLDPLMTALRNRQLRVESAGFCPQEEVHEHGEHHELGPSCMFIP